MNQQPQKSSFTTPSNMTLEEVKISIAAATDFSPTKKSELLSAVNSFALWLHRAPAEITADYAYVDRAFARLNFGTLGVSRARFRNVRSLLKAALRLAGVLPASRTKADLSPDWTALRDRVAGPYAKDCLRTFFRFCSTRGIRPDQVDDQVAESFLEELQANAASKPMVSVQSAIRLWNKQIDVVEGWPHVRLTPVSRREFYCLKPQQLHADLVADIELFLSITSGADPTHPLSPKRPLRPRSVKKREYQLHQLLAGMHHAGVNLGELRRLADLCNVDLVRKGLSFHIQRYRQRHGKDADPLVSTMIGGIADAIRIVAKHYVDAPEPIVRELTAIACRFSRRSSGITEKNLTMLAQLDSPHMLQRFLSYPPAEMAKLARKPSITRLDAVRYATLLAIEILIVAPMRIENLARLDLDVHFVWTPDHRSAIVIRIPRKLVKNRVALEYKIPRRSVVAFRTYLNRFRRLLVSKPSSALFPGRNGQAKRSDTLSHQIKNLIRKELGIEWTAHVFRHSSVRILLRANPGDYETPRRVLGHSSAEMLRRAYDAEEAGPAFDVYDALIESILDPKTSNSGRPRNKGNKKRKR